MRSKGKHVWATHKCECSLALNVWGAVKKDIDLVYNLYKADFDYFGLEKGQFVI